MKNLLTRWETEKDNLINSQYSGEVLLIDRKLTELENDAECVSLPKFTELEDDAKYASFLKAHRISEKPSNLTGTRKEKLHRLISHSSVYFLELVGRPCFCFIGGLADLTDGLAIGGAESRERKIAISFSR